MSEEEKPLWLIEREICGARRGVSGEIVKHAEDYLNEEDRRQVIA